VIFSVFVLQNFRENESIEFLLDFIQIRKSEHVETRETQKYGNSFLSHCLTLHMLALDLSWVLVVLKRLFCFVCNRCVQNLQRHMWHIQVVVMGFVPFAFALMRLAFAYITNSSWVFLRVNC
jgi:hypothetical protein